MTEDKKFGSLKVKANLINKWLSKMASSAIMIFPVPGEDIFRIKGIDFNTAGFRIAENPRNANVLLVTDPVPEGLRQKVATIFAQMPRPRIYVFAGTGTIHQLPEPDLRISLNEICSNDFNNRLRELLANPFSPEPTPYKPDFLKEEPEEKDHEGHEHHQMNDGNSSGGKKDEHDHEHGNHDHNEKTDHHEKDHEAKNGHDDWHEHHKRHNEHSQEEHSRKGHQIHKPQNGQPQKGQDHDGYEQTGDGSHHDHKQEGKQKQGQDDHEKSGAKEEHDEHKDHVIKDDIHNKEKHGDSRGHKGHDKQSGHKGNGKGDKSRHEGKGDHKKHDHSNHEEHDHSGHESHGDHSSHQGNGGHEGHDHGGGFMSMVMMTKDMPRSVDGLPMEHNKCWYGPFFPSLPGGLAINLTLDGDTVLNAEVEKRLLHRNITKSLKGKATELPQKLSGVSVLSPESYKILGEQLLKKAAGKPADLSFNQIIRLEKERMANHLNWLVSLGILIGNQWLNKQAVGFLYELNKGRSIGDELKKFFEQLRKSFYLRKKLSKNGKIPDVLLHHLSGPAKRAAGSDSDKRNDDENYGKLEFKSITVNENNSWGRFLVRLNEIEQSSGLIVKAETLINNYSGDEDAFKDEDTFTEESVLAASDIETSRGLSAIRGWFSGGEIQNADLMTASGINADLINTVISEMELSDALLVIHSLDIDPWEMAEYFVEKNN